MPSDATLLETIHEHYTSDSQEWADVLREGNKDMQVLTGDVWGVMDPNGKRQRIDAKRPFLALDELGQYLNQVVNDVRANPRGMKFSPTGTGANDQGADFYQNKAREIEYRSHAQMAYTTAFENAVQRGFGYTRLSTKYVHDAVFDRDREPDLSLFDQELWIDPIVDPNMVLPYPYFQRPDLSDQQRCFVLQWRTIAEFKREFGNDAKRVNFTPDLATQAPGWFTPDMKRLLIAEYWSKDEVGTRTLLRLKPQATGMVGRVRSLLGAAPSLEPTVVWRDTLATMPASDQILDSREVPILKVRQRLTNGVEILETNEWPGQYIPITGCFGKMFYVDDGEKGATRKILSMTRLARDPFMLYCYYRTCEAELVAMTPKFPYFVFEGQLSPQSLELLQKSLHEPVAVIEVKPYVPGMTPTGQPLGYPQRNPYDPPIQALELGAEAARRAIQSAMGITPLPTPVQRENQKSGKALQQIESSGQRGSFHFVDHYEDMIRQTGVMIEDLISPIYAGPRDVGVRKPDGTALQVRVNDPTAKEPVSTEGSYQVTVSTGPSTESQRQAADDLVDGLVSNIGMVAEIAGPDVAKKMLAESIRNKVQGPSGDLLADLISPPQKGQMTPELMAAQQQTQQLQAALKQATEALQAESVKYAAQFKIEEMKANKKALLDLFTKKLDLHQRLIDRQMDDATRIEVARIAAAKQSADLAREAQEEALALGLEHAHEAAMTAADQAHEVGMAAMTPGGMPPPASGTDETVPTPTGGMPTPMSGPM